MKKVKVGLLPLYIKLYDDGDPHGRDPMVRYLHTAVSMLEAEDLELVCAPVCRVKAEFEEASSLFQKEQIDALVTLHLAYSPSLEAIDAVMALDAPVIVLDTTLRYDFASRMSAEDVMPNHGIHGVQDFCNLLKRRGKPYFVEAGHLLHSDVISRVAGLCRAARAAKALKTARVGAVGGAFRGMGDFLVPPAALKKQIGATVVELSAARAAACVAAVTEEELAAEQARDAELFSMEVKNPANYRASLEAGLGLRKWAQEEKLTALTVNFLAIDSESGLPKMPFAELSKMMMGGLGYAGEGDTLTAALVGALLTVYQDTTFTEMFCPDWKENVIFLSHMGEMNLKLSAFRPVLTDKPFPYASSGDTVSAYGCMRPGKAVLVNLAPLGDHYALLLSPVTMLPLGREFGAFRQTTEGWMQPEKPLAQFLKDYSLAGGTHHSALVYDADPAELAAFGAMMGFEVIHL